MSRLPLRLAPLALALVLAGCLDPTQPVPPGTEDVVLAPPAGESGKAAQAEPATEPSAESGDTVVLPGPGGLLERRPDTCGAARLADLIGQPAEAAEALDLDRPVRIIRPGDLVTQEYNPRRVNIRLDAAGRIAAIDCG